LEGAFLHSIGLIELLVFVAVIFALTKPLGRYLYAVLETKERMFLTPVVGPVERLFYRLTGIGPETEQSWRQYTVSVLCFSFVSCVFTYAVLRLQNFLPLNPRHFGPVSDHLSFNTAVSFMTNTNWQSYAGESTLSYFSQMVGLVFQNFASAAVGIAVAAAFVRGIARQSADSVGNFWRDLVRITLYVLLPLSVVLAIFLVSQGVIQNFRAYQTAVLVAPATRLRSSAGDTAQTAAAATAEESVRGPGGRERTTLIQSIVQGPIASQEAIKLLGTNGGGYVNANSAHPYENPTPLSNFVEMLSILLIPSGLTYYFGRAVRNQRHGWAVWAAMLTLLLLGFFVTWSAEISGNPRLHALGVDPAYGNMEGKEVRFGIFDSALFATVTTDVSCGAVNSMHDSYTPIGGLVPLLNIQLGEVVFGGVGSGLYGMLVFVILAVFIAGLMIGRTPEYLGKKIESYEVKLCVIAILALIFDILWFTAWAVTSRWGLSGVSNAGPHGLSEILYAFSSATGNNGSAFAGLGTNTYWFNTTMGLAMLIGRFGVIVPVLALAGHLARKKSVPLTRGSFPVSGILFVLLLVGTVLIVGALTFFPVLSLGPVLEHFMMVNSGIVF
jgi:K+-transporting ATPase ATPase A chain